MPGVNLAALLVFVLASGEVPAATVQEWWLEALSSIRGSITAARHVLTSATATVEMWARHAPVQGGPGPQPFDLLGVVAAVLHDHRADVSLQQRARHCCASKASTGFRISCLPGQEAASDARAGPANTDQAS